MAAYYIRRRPASVSNTRPLSREENGGNDTREELAPLDTISADQSIYIFPNPPSTPSTPLSPGSSFVSSPTDLESEELASYVDSQRGWSVSTGALTPTSESGGAELTRRDAPTFTDNELEIDVELWELSPDPSESDESWVLEEQVQRINAAGIDVSFVSPSHTPHRPRKLSAPQSPDTIAKHYWILRPQRRSRSHSRNRSISTVSSLTPPSARRAAPHPRIHIPLLSFFSSLLSVDPDDPALRLLTHAEPGDAESVLFPGHTTAQLLSRGTSHILAGERNRDLADDIESSAAVDTDASHPSEPGDGQRHGLPKLLLASFSDPSTAALRSLRAGLAIYVPQAPGMGLPLPSTSGLLGLWRVVGEVWKEVWGGGSNSVDADAGPL